VRSYTRLPVVQKPRTRFETIGTFGNIYDGIVTKNYDVRVFNILGSQVNYLHMQFDSEEFIIDDIPGIYFVVVTNQANPGEYWVHKIVNTR
jgi:hypothetical protein